MAKNGKIFFDVNFNKSIITEYIKTNLKDLEPNDKNIDLLYQNIIANILEEAIPNLRDLYINKYYKFVEIKIIGHKEEPVKDYVDVKIDPENTTDIIMQAKI